MNVLSISTDRKVFEQGSAVRSRLLEYGRLARELHVIVFAKKTLGFHDEKIAPNIFLYPTNSLSKLSYIFSAFSIALMLRKKEVSIDVVTTQDPFETGLAGYFISQIFKTGLHLQIHTDFMSPLFARESFINRVRVLIAKFLITHANGIRVVSERIKNSLQTTNYKLPPVTVLPIFVETKKTIESQENNLKKKYPQFDKIFLVASRLSREKNIDMALEAMRAIAREYPKAGLVIMGEGPELIHLKELTKKYSLDSSVIFEGWQSDLTPYYKSADAFLLTSNYEGYGMTVVEALSQGCPVIMTDVGCAGELVQDGKNGLIVPVDDIKALVQATGGIVSGDVKITPIIQTTQTKEEYLSAYKKSWENAVAKQGISC